MVTRKSIFILLVTIGGICAVVLAYVAGQRPRANRWQPSCDQVYVNLDAARQGKSTESYGKIKIPAELSISLAQAEDAAAPVTIIVSASSLVPASSGIVTLRVPRIGAQGESTHVLWSGTQRGFIAETARYAVDALPVGQYCLVTTLEFTPDDRDAKKLVLSKSLYLDVRPTTILSSNVSFTHIKRLELLKELEERAAASLSPGLATAGPRKMAGEIALIKARYPGLIARRIAELRASDPDVARRIMELNQTRAQITEVVDAVGPRRDSRPDTEGPAARAPSRRYRGRPASEKAVPVRQRPDNRTKRASQKQKTSALEGI